MALIGKAGFERTKPQVTIGTVMLPERTEMVVPGVNLTFNDERTAPIAMEETLRCAIREGGRTAGAGVVSRIPAQGDAGLKPGLPRKCGGRASARHNGN